ncbi:MerR family transcriptional regulator [Saccharothrix yanglingensis]|uniref:MerR family transcriptional regulator n=1 Tax=Saccharothrix yanglingensis TaxID=659496 RepID=A0ABU0X3E7_9PSEU|nr:MerR family transcriptional regulator [Saccharothrix yanglingensis]MDQ2585094.1 MerR family transcriptional regulator [Saccharothrix yanglingensis]
MDGQGGAVPGTAWTPGAVARMLGVSPTTLRTWDRRYGLGPSSRTSGNHRRYTTEDVERLRRVVAGIAKGLAPAVAAATALGDPPPPGPPPGAAEPGDGGPGIGPADAKPARRGFLRAAHRLDEPLMRAAAIDLITRHGVVEAWQHVFTPVLVELGRRAAARGRGVEAEHLASAAILHALRGVPLPDERGRLAALLSCAPDEQHVLPLEALGAALSERGATWRNLGARLPALALLDAVDKLRPASVVVWAHREDIARQVPLDELVDRFDAVVTVGGAGWGAVTTPPGVVRPTSVEDAVRVVLEATGR